MIENEVGKRRHSNEIGMKINKFSSSGKRRNVHIAVIVSAPVNNEEQSPVSSDTIDSIHRRPPWPTTYPANICKQKNNKKPNIVKRNMNVNNLFDIFATRY